MRSSTDGSVGVGLKPQEHESTICHSQQGPLASTSASADHRPSGPEVGVDDHMDDGAPNYDNNADEILESNISNALAQSDFASAHNLCQPNSGQALRGVDQGEEGQDKGKIEHMRLTPVSMSGTFTEGSTPSDGSKPTAEANTVQPMQAGQIRADANMHTTAVTAACKASYVKGSHDDDDGTTLEVTRGEEE